MTATQARLFAGLVLCHVVVWGQENTPEECDSMVDAMRDEYQAKCLTPLDACTPSAEGLRAFVSPEPPALILRTRVCLLCAPRRRPVLTPGAPREQETLEAFCGAAGEDVCSSSLDCTWDMGTESCATSRPARWRVLCDHDRHRCPQNPQSGCSPTCQYPTCGDCSEVDYQWCQSVFNTIIENCGNVPRNSTRLDSAGELESYADWPFEEERVHLTQMGCDAGPFSTAHGLERFLQQEVAIVCSIAIHELGRHCACVIDSQGVQECDPSCLSDTCQRT